MGLQYIEKKIIMFGAGRHASTVLNYLNDISSICYFVDNDTNKWNKNIRINNHEFMVYSPAKIISENLDEFIFILSTMYEEDVFEQFTGMLETKQLRPLFYKVIKRGEITISIIQPIPINSIETISLEFILYPFNHFNMIYCQLYTPPTCLTINTFYCLNENNEFIETEPYEIVATECIIQDNIISSDILIDNKSGFKSVYFEATVDRSLKTQTDRVSFSLDAYPDGVNLLGNIRGSSGLAQGCRLLAAAIEETGLDWTAYSCGQANPITYQDNTYLYKINNVLKYNINVFHLNALEPEDICFYLDDAFRKSHYNIGFWLWELEAFPDRWLHYLRFVDEIWTPSEFISNNLRKVTNKPVFTIPYPVLAPIDHECNRAFFHLPKEQFLFLCMYDSNSTMERKNPIGAITAYKIAFPKERDDVGLIIKVNHPSKSDLDRLYDEMRGYKNVYYILDTYPKEQVNSLIACADVFVSLHRAEGFGLVLAEAMLLRTSVIATNWSSNTEFMNRNVACMVDYDLVPVNSTSWIYKKGTRWADPDLNQAAECMNKLYNDKNYYKEITTSANEYISHKLNTVNSASLICKRIKEIYANNR